MATPAEIVRSSFGIVPICDDEDLISRDWIDPGVS